MSKPEAIVFVVDDDESVRESLGSLIRSAGLEVETFASAQQFLAGPRSETVGAMGAPSCLVLDVHLPGLSGLELQERMARLRHELDLARTRLHDACRAVTSAETALLAWQAEREEAALQLARLADELERLEGAVVMTSGGACVH